MSKKIIVNLMIAGSLMTVLVLATQVFAGGDEQVTVCHKTGSGYKVQSFDSSALQAHLDHGDIYPVPVNGCPAEVAPTPAPGATPEPIAILLFGAGLTGVGYVTRRYWGSRSDSKSI